MCVMASSHLALSFVTNWYLNVLIRKEKGSKDWKSSKILGLRVILSFASCLTLRVVTLPLDFSFTVYIMRLIISISLGCADYKR